MATDDRLYFRQLLSGRDFAVGDPIAGQMVNFVYAIGDRATGECVLVDPAYAVDDLVDAVEADGMTVAGVLATHYHPDHVGGSMMGYTIEGVAGLLERVACPVHVQRAEVAVGGHARPASPRPSSSPTMPATSSPSARSRSSSSTRPGHTPGSQCFLVDGRLVSGDTLFLDGCGRTDLPGSDPGRCTTACSASPRCPTTPSSTPGHRYSLPSSAHDGGDPRAELRLPARAPRSSG